MSKGLSFVPVVAKGLYIEENACCSQISRETFLAHRAQCAKLQKDKLDLVILSLIDAHGSGQSECTEPRVYTERFVAHFYLNAVFYR